MRQQALGTYIPPKKTTKNSSKRASKSSRTVAANDVNKRRGIIRTKVDNPYDDGPVAHGQSGRQSDGQYSVGQCGVSGRRQQVVDRRLSDNPLLTMLARGRINQAQFRAGEKYAAAYLVSTGQVGQGMDYEKQRVDCSLSPMSLTERQVHASDVIRNAHRELNEKGQNEKAKGEAALRVQKIVGEGLTITQYAAKIRNLTSARSVSKQSGLLREDLTVLAKFWGFEG